MIYHETKINLFDFNKEFVLGHCISSDCEMGQGIAVDFQRHFKIRTRLLKYTEEERKHPNCILVDNVFNLITKNRFFNKPTYKSIELALIKMKEIAIDKDIKYIGLPKIGSGLDKLSWVKVREMIQEIFNDTDIMILVSTYRKGV